MINPQDREQIDHCLGMDPSEMSDPLVQWLERKLSQLQLRLQRECFNRRIPTLKLGKEDNDGR